MPLLGKSKDNNEVGNMKIIGIFVFGGLGLFDILLDRVFLIQYWRTRLIIC